VRWFHHRAFSVAKAIEGKLHMNLKSGWSRRSFLSTIGAAVGGLFAPSRLNAAGFLGKKPVAAFASDDGSPIVPITSGLGSTGDIYAELGVTPLININGTVTVIGGSVMKPEVMELIRRGNQHFVLIDELEVAAGKFIAKLCKSPAGYTGLVTGGAAAAMVVGYAGMMTEDWESRIREVPDITNCPRHEVIIQKSHRYPFDHQIRQTGAKLIEVETREEMIAAINPKTLAIHFTNILSDQGKVSGPETVAIAKAHNIYTFNDASADVPPVSRLWEYPAIGFDMVTFSGGKDICGPQASGILIGSSGAGASGMRGRVPEPTLGSSSKPVAVHQGGGHRDHDPNTFGFAVWQIKDGEDKVIADRLVEILSSASKA